jgi:ferritin
MLSQKMNEALNRQVLLEAQASQDYLAMGSWAETQPGLKGVTQFFYRHSDEERMHMLKLIHFINERGGVALIPPLEQPTHTFASLKAAFNQLYHHELKVSESINDLVEAALMEKDYATHNFLQWFVTEQMEEERLAKDCNDKLELIGNDRSGLYLFDRDVLSIDHE